jgi:predicted lipid-binding transport protein (Tim44 family)
VSREMIEILILAVIAGVVVMRLYAVLGRKTGSERPSVPPPSARGPAPAPVETGMAKPAPAAQPAPMPAGPAMPGFAEIAARDPAFEPNGFLGGAKSAYEMIVQAFAQADRETLRGLLTPRVFSSYDQALTQRAADGAPGPELVRLRSAEIVSAAMFGDLARVAVRFEAELAEGAHGLRDTKEKWTFERDVRDRNPNWFLAAVAQA